MILHLKKSISDERATEIANSINAFHFKKEQHILITGAAMKEVPGAIAGEVEGFWVFDNDIQLASKKYRSAKRSVSIGKTVIGGESNKMILIGGPCSVESEDQIRESAELIKGMGLTTLRGGCYKPRTSPYSFQGMGLDGLKLLAKMRDDYGLDGAMIGRATIGNPWFFKQVKHFFETGEHYRPITMQERVEAARRHLQMSIDWKGEVLGVFETRRHYTNYFKGIPDFKPHRMKMVTSDASEDVFAAFDEALEKFGDHQFA